MLRGDGGRSGGAELSEVVGLDDRLDPGVLEREQDDEERRSAGQPQKRLQPGVAELTVDARHDREDAVRQLHPHARRVVDHASCKPFEARLDRGDRVEWSQELGDLLLGDVQVRPAGFEPATPGSASRCSIP